MSAIRHFHFQHEAMNTVFTVTIAQPDVSETYAGSAANALFTEIDRLEEELSRFRPGSDIHRLGQLKAGESTAVSLACWDCLALAKAVHEETSGAFDITIGPLMRLWRNQDGTPRQPDEQELERARRRIGSHLFELERDGLLVRVLADKIAFDLGALGKGYALDQCAGLLEDWSITSALLNAGDSTLLGLGAPPGDPGWIVTPGGDQQQRICLKNRAISGTGFAVQGAHIMDPRTFRPVPIRAGRSHASAPTAALSDALSTAFMVMEPEAVAAFCQRHPEVEALVI